jgi:hypothetical protein
MCNQNKRVVKDILASTASSNDNNALPPFEFAVFANSSSSQSSSGFTWPTTALENKPKMILDTSNLDEQDLELLKK